MTQNPFRDLGELKAQQKEFKLHLAVVEQLPIWYPQVKFLHIPNRPGDASDGYFKKLMGSAPGASDLLVGWKFGSKLGGAGFIELKAPDGVVSSTQNKFLSGWATIGFHTGIARSCREVYALIERWGVKPASSAIREPDYRTVNEKRADAFDLYAPR